MRSRLLPLVAGTVLFWAGLYVFVPVLAPQAHRLGAGVAVVGAVLATYGLAGFLFRLPVGLISDGAGRRKPFVLLAMVLAGGAALAMAYARTPGELALLRGLSGVAASGWVAMTVLTAEAFPGEGTVWALGMVNAAAGGGQLLAMPLGGWLAQAGSFRPPFVAGAVLCLLAALVALRFPEGAPAGRRRAPPLEGLLRAGRAPALRRAATLGALLQYVLYVCVYGFIPLVAKTDFRATGWDLGLLSLVMCAPLTFAPLAAGRLQRRLGRVPLLQACAGTAAVGAAAIAFAPGIGWLALAGMLVGVGYGIATPLLMSTAVEAVPPALRGGGMGLYQSLYAVGSFSGPALAGAIGAAAGLRVMFFTTAGVALVAAILAGRLNLAGPTQGRT